MKFVTALKSLVSDGPNLNLNVRMQYTSFLNYLPTDPPLLVLISILGLPLYLIEPPLLARAKAGRASLAFAGS